MLEQIAHYPRGPTKKHASIEKAHIEDQSDRKVRVDDTAFRPEIPVAKSLYICRDDIRAMADKSGATPGCRGCQAALSGERAVGYSILQSSRGTNFSQSEQGRRRMKEVARRKKKATR